MGGQLWGPHPTPQRWDPAHLRRDPGSSPAAPSRRSRVLATPTRTATFHKPLSEKEEETKTRETPSRDGQQQAGALDPTRRSRRRRRAVASTATTTRPPAPAAPPSKGREEVSSQPHLQLALRHLVDLANRLPHVVHLKVHQHALSLGLLRQRVAQQVVPPGGVRRPNCSAARWEGLGLGVWAASRQQPAPQAPGRASRGPQAVLRQTAPTPASQTPGGPPREGGGKARSRGTQQGQVSAARPSQ